MNNLFDIRGKRAIVTGGSRGIGKGIAKGIHDAGVELVGMVIYLASKASDYVHGTVQLVDGGWQAR
jgi:NAD(P)-dependent dehydrogenase (short-subunit alcohol dehydrogenase family)